ncbi:hypothetical protein ScPMuIL_009188 [Solemya velum]
MHIRLVLIFILTTILSVSSLKCYSCDSATAGDKCDETIDINMDDKKYITEDCEACKKTLKKRGANYSVVRLCVTENIRLDKDWQCTTKRSGNAEDTFCFCKDEDFCNGSGITKVPFFVDIVYESNNEFTFPTKHDVPILTPDRGMTVRRVPSAVPVY